MRPLPFVSPPGAGQSRPTQSVDALDADAPDDPDRPRRLDWATLMKRAYAVDVLVPEVLWVDVNNGY